MIRIPCFHCRRPGFNPWGTKIPQVTWQGQKKTSIPLTIWKCKVFRITKGWREKEQLKFSYMAVENIKSHNTLENSLTNFHKSNISKSFDHIISFLGIYPRDIKIYSHTKTFYTNILKRQNLKTTQMLINRQMDKQIVLYSNNEILSAKKTNKQTNKHTCNTMNEFWKHAERKNSDSKKSTHSVFLFMWKFRKEKNLY